MFYNYNEASGNFKISGSKDPQVIELTAGKMIKPINGIVILSWVMTIPCIAITLTIVGALIGVPAALGLWWMRGKAKKSISEITQAKSDYIKAIQSDEPLK